MLRLHILASGSGGNAAIVENAATGEGVLVDCGICKRDFFARAEEAGFNLEKLRAVVITHDHGDHTKGLGVVLRGLAKAGAHPAVCASEAVFAASAPLREAVASVGAAFEPFDGGDRLDLAGLAVRPFRTSHDAADSYGFRFEERGSGCDSLGYMTDTGVVTDAAWEALSGVHLLALESNHDARMLQMGPYPYVIKQRIASARGHLSNDNAAEAAIALCCRGVRGILLGHLSSHNNTKQLAYDTVRAACERAGIQVDRDLALRTANRRSITGTYPCK